MLSKKEAIELLHEGYVSPRSLNLEVIAADVPTSTGCADFLIDPVWNGKRKGFIAEFKAVATPKKVMAAIRAANSFTAEMDDRLPMILVPHFSKETAERLQEEEVSGIDFSGNISSKMPAAPECKSQVDPNHVTSSLPRVRSERSSTTRRTS